MVYDPIRDCEVPSPATTTHPNSAGWHEERTPGRDHRSGHPPAFAGHGSRSPSSHVRAGVTRSTSGGLRGLLNDEPPETRRSSEQRSSISSTMTEDHSHQLQQQQYQHPNPSSSSSASRPSIHQLLNSTPAPALTKSNSSSSITHSSSPGNFSPGARYQLLDPDGFLTPATPAVHPPRRMSRSPHPNPIDSISPRPGHYQLPAQDLYDRSGPSRRTSGGSSTTPRPMLPPQDIPHSHRDYYDPSRVTPGPYSLPLRSPSVSVSPRAYHQALPSALPAHPSSRPGSSTSNNHPFSYHPSPSHSDRRLSEDHSRPTSASGQGRRATLPQRRVSEIDLRSPQRPPMGSPIPVHRALYDPNRTSRPAQALFRPITQAEIADFLSAGQINNRLRAKKRKPLPSWSGQPSSSRLPSEQDTSYFPQHQTEQMAPGHGRSQPTSGTTGRRGSMSAGRSATPVQANGQRSHSGNGHHDPNHLKRPSDTDDHGPDSSRRKVSGSQYVGNAYHVADHYNSRPEVGVQNRELSPIIGLKKFNNWIKSVLIGKFAYRQSGGAKVLDIGCGKGGDLNKWKQARIRLYVGMDIAATSVEQAYERYQRMNRPGFDGYFFAHDCYSRSIKEALPDELSQPNLYDNVTMQFCMHYAFETPSKARMMLENVSRSLKPGGAFIGTIPDSRQLLERLAEIPEDEPDLRFGNSCYFVTFEERRHKGLYGHQYRFYLEDAVGDVPEYIVDWDNFEALAMEYRLRLVYKKAFNEVLQEEQGSRDFGPLLGKMGVVNENGESAMDADQWEAANLYMAFAFQRV